MMERTERMQRSKDLNGQIYRTQHVYRFGSVSAHGYGERSIY